MASIKSVKTLKTTSSMRPPLSANASYGGAAISAAANMNKPSVIHPPSLQSNLQRDSDQDVVFNSIGFYSDLLGRLDEQISSTEEVFLKSQYKLAESNEAMRQSGLPPSAHHI